MSSYKTCFNINSNFIRIKYKYHYTLTVLSRYRTNLSQRMWLPTSTCPQKIVPVFKHTHTHTHTHQLSSCRKPVAWDHARRRPPLWSALLRKFRLGMAVKRRVALKVPRGGLQHMILHATTPLQGISGAASPEDMLFTSFRNVTHALISSLYYTLATVALARDTIASLSTSVNTYCTLRKFPTSRDSPIRLYTLTTQ